MAALIVSFSVSASAEAPGDMQAISERTPPELRAWIPWVLAPQSERDCRKVSSGAVCAWPGELLLDLSQKSGRFEQRVLVDNLTDVALPGSEEHWPERVILAGKPVVVLLRDGAPSVRLPAGEHVLRGEFSWIELPEAMKIAPSTGRVALTVNGKPIPFPKRDAGGTLWIQAAEGETGDADALTLDVFRRIDDGVPVRVTTRLLLRVSGRSREQDLGKLLISGTVPLSVSSELPARFETNGGLRIQLRPGTHTIEIVARADKNDALSAPRHDAPWPAQEFWVFAANPALREAELSGPASIDPAQTSLPLEWRQLPAYAIAGGETLELRTTRQGEAEPPPNQLSLMRVLWLDQDGEAFTVRDHFSGRMFQGFRLDVTEGELGHVVDNQRDQLITQNPKSGKAGVELRTGTVQLTAESRMPFSRDIAAIGWSEDVKSLSARLRLPPGYQLFAVSGVDRAPGTWLESWDLFAFFFVLIVALATWKLSSWPWGLLALVTLVTCHGEEAAPKYLFIVLLAAWALLRVLPQGRLRWWLRATFAVAALAFVVVWVGFAVNQVRAALYPQLASPEGESAAMFGLQEQAPAAASEPLSPPPYPSRKGMGLSGVSEEHSKEGGTGEVARITKQDPKAVVQTGPGIPTWSFREWQLTWSGPVDRNQRVTFYVVSPELSGILNIARVLLLALLGAHLLRSTPFGTSSGGSSGARVARSPALEPTPADAPEVSGHRALMVLLTVTLGMLITIPARAQIPSPELLNELRERLSQPPSCGDACLTVPSAELEVVDDILTLRAVLHAGAPVTFRLPGPAQSWVHRRLLLDGKPSFAVALSSDGYLHLRLEPGAHELVLEGAIAGDELTLAFEDAPRRMRVSAPDFEVGGLRTDGRTSGSIHLLRRLQNTKGAALPAWFEVERKLQIGVTWTIQSTVTRVTPVGTPAVLRYRLLDGESVTDSTGEVVNGELVLSLGRDQVTQTWSSELRPRESLTLRAPEGAPWTETWILACGVVFHCKPRGLAPVSHLTEGRWEPRYRPFPGETLQISLPRPAASPGSSSTVDHVDYTVSPGTRLLDGKLALAIRSSTGGLQKLRLPEGAKLQQLRVDGAERAMRQVGRDVPIMLGTGDQRLEVDFQKPGGMSTHFRVPEISLGQPSVNVNVVVHMPSERWLLLAGGPSWGPAILFWGYLVVVVLVAIGLGRVQNSPLSTWQWLLLGLGMTQVSFAVPLIVAGWFFLLQYRRSLRIERPYFYNAVQVAVALSTLTVIILFGVTVYDGLVVRPDMQVAGAGSSNERLAWYADRASALLPAPWVLSVPLWIFRVLMLLWALWLAASVVRWLRKAWSSFSTGPLWIDLHVFRTLGFGAARRPAVQGFPNEPPPQPEPEGPPPERVSPERTPD